jgi:hypothetical protein
MRDDTTTQGPGDGGCEIVVLIARQHEHPIHTASDTVKTSAGRQKSELHRVDADVSCVTSRDVTVSFGGKFD